MWSFYKRLFSFSNLWQIELLKCDYIKGLCVVSLDTLATKLFSDIDGTNFFKWIGFKTNDHIRIFHKTYSTFRFGDGSRDDEAENPEPDEDKSDSKRFRFLPRRLIDTGCGNGLGVSDLPFSTLESNVCSTNRVSVVLNASTSPVLSFDPTLFSMCFVVTLVVWVRNGLRRDWDFRISVELLAGDSISELSLDISTGVTSWFSDDATENTLCVGDELLAKVCVTNRGFLCLFFLTPTMSVSWVAVTSAVSTCWGLIVISSSILVSLSGEMSLASPTFSGWEMSPFSWITSSSSSKLFFLELILFSEIPLRQGSAVVDGSSSVCEEFLNSSFFSDKSESDGAEQPSLADEEDPEFAKSSELKIFSSLL